MITGIAAGTQLDKLIDEVVFRYHPEPENLRLEKREIGGPWYVGDSNLMWRQGPVPQYSTSIEAAWTILDKICQPGSRYSRAEVTLRPPWTLIVRLIDVSDLTGYKERGMIEAEAETLPLAICYAALEAA